LPPSPLLWYTRYCNSFSQGIRALSQGSGAAGEAGDGPICQHMPDTKVVLDRT
jgi:hypothetical protein